MVWKPPSSCTFKLNVDVAVNENRQQFSIGGTVRDNQGHLLLAFGKHINQPISVVHGELMAIREVLLSYMIKALRMFKLQRILYWQCRQSLPIMKILVIMTFV